MGETGPQDDCKGTVNANSSSSSLHRNNRIHCIQNLPWVLLWEKGIKKSQVDLNFLCPPLQTHLSTLQPPSAHAGFVFNIKLSVHDS